MTPDLFEPIIGYRLWPVLPNGLLTSRNDEMVWPPRKAAMAYCRATPSRYHVDHNCEWIDPPVFDCTCGLYAHKTLEGVEKATTYYGPRFYAVGRVALWGRVVEHTDGYRAQYAYPLDVQMTFPYQFKAGKSYRWMVHHLYGIPVQVDYEKPPEHPKEKPEEPVYGWGFSGFIPAPSRSRIGILGWLQANTWATPRFPTAMVDWSEDSMIWQPTSPLLVTPEPKTEPLSETESERIFLEVAGLNDVQKILRKRL